jgi:hypothetical protein
MRGYSLKVVYGIWILHSGTYGTELRYAVLLFLLSVYVRRKSMFSLCVVPGTIAYCDVNCTWHRTHMKFRSFNSIKALTLQRHKHEV